MSGTLLCRNDTQCRPRFGDIWRCRRHVGDTSATCGAKPSSPTTDQVTTQVSTTTIDSHMAELRQKHTNNNSNNNDDIPATNPDIHNINDTDVDSTTTPRSLTEYARGCSPKLPPRIFGIEREHTSQGWRGEVRRIQSENGRFWP